MRNLLFSLLLLPALSLAAESPYLTALPAGKIKVEVMQPAVSQRGAELTARLIASVEKNREWWMAHVEKAPPGEPLPWDERMGLTRAEYDELQKAASEARLEKTSEAELEFDRSAAGKIVIRPDASLPELDGIVIELKNDVVDTPFGRAAGSSAVTANDGQKATGPWNGVQWKLDSTGEVAGSGTMVRFAIGKLAADGRGLLYYDAREVKPGGERREATRVLIFALPK